MPPEPLPLLPLPLPPERLVLPPMPLPELPLPPGRLLLPPIPLPPLELPLPPMPLPPGRLLLPPIPLPLLELPLPLEPLPDVLLLPGSIDPMDVARSRTWSTTRLMTLRVAGLAPRAAATAATPAAAPVPAAIMVLVMRLRSPFFAAARRDGVLRRALAFFPLFRAEPALFVELFFEPPRFFDPALRFFELLLLEERFFDEERFLLDELRERFFDAFFEERRELFLDAAMLCLLLNVRCGGTGSGIRNHAACNVSGARVARTTM